MNVRRTDLEAAFIDYLERFTPRPEYLALFREVVLDAWQERHTEAADARKRLETQLAEVRRHRDRLEEAFIYERKIDRATYERQRDKLAEDETMLELTLSEARLDELDVEALVAFAEHLLLNVARMWSEAALDQKQRLQQVLFPAGVTFGDAGFGTQETSLVFQLLGTPLSANEGETVGVA